MATSADQAASCGTVEGEVVFVGFEVECSICTVGGDIGFACAGSAARASKLRYPLRSASSGKAAAPPEDAPPSASDPRRYPFFSCSDPRFVFLVEILRCRCELISLVRSKTRSL